MNVDLAQTQNNVYYKKCDGTYNERLKEMIDTGDISLRGLKDNAKVFDEIIFDINSDYFEQNGGYEFAKEFYEKAFHFAKQEMSAKNIISAVMHADELNIALTEEYGKPIYHYHLHVIAIPVVKKEIKWSQRCKDKSLIGTTKEIINQVSHSKKWKSQQATDLQGNYDKEQQELTTKIEQLSKDIENTEKKDTDITQFISNVKKYTEITKLSAEILNELIEKIVIHQQEKVNGKKFQEIDIYYRGVGIISFPVSHENNEITINKILNRKTA